MCDRFSDNIITFNVSGVPIKISTEILAKHPESLLTTMVYGNIQPSEGWFVECCPKIFSYLLRFLIHDIKVHPWIVSKELGTTETEVRKVIDRFKFKEIYVTDTKVEQFEAEMHQSEEKAVDSLKAITDELYKDIWLSAQRGEIKKLRLLRDQGYNLDIKCINWGSTPLMYATKGGHLDCVMLLIKHGVDVRAKNRTDREVLHFAIENNRPDLINFLIEKGANINAIEKTYGYTPLFRAVSLRKEGPIINLLLQLGADPNVKDNKGKTLLHCASNYCTMNIMRHLATKCSNLNDTTLSGQTILHVVAELGFLSEVKFLLELGADPTVKDIRGDTPLMVAKKYEHYGIVNMLRKHIVFSYC